MRGLIYDLTTAPLTTSWYARALAEVPRGSHFLDVGIGTGLALCRNARVVVERDLTITGLDIDAEYLRRCRRNLARVALDERVHVREESILDHRGGPYQALCFSASFMLMPDQDVALERARQRLEPGGLLLFTQTFEERPSRFMEWLKPRLRTLTTIEFGTVTYESAFLDTLRRGGVAVEDMVTLSRGRRRSFRLVVARPPAPVPVVPTNVPPGAGRGASAGA